MPTSQVVACQDWPEERPGVKWRDEPPGEARAAEWRIVAGHPLRQVAVESSVLKVGYRGDRIAIGGGVDRPVGRPPSNEYQGRE